VNVWREAPVHAGEAKPSPRFFTHVFAGGVLAGPKARGNPSGKNMV